MAITLLRFYLNILPLSNDLQLMRLGHHIFSGATQEHDKGWGYPTNPQVYKLVAEKS